MILTTNTPYPSRKKWRIRAYTHQRPQRNEDQYAKVNLDNSTNNVLIPLDSWTSGLLVYKSPLSVDNDVEFDTNGGTSNLGNNEATPSESSFMNIDNDGEFASNTLIDRSDKGYGTNNLLEQLRDSYPNNDDYDPYDDDMYENHDLSEHLQSICDDLDITVRGRKKK
ncbi:hypothetical protein Tco_1177148 [Tanacetum coccineum]